jgi:alpha-L-rhamnosidase
MADLTAPDRLRVEYRPAPTTAADRPRFRWRPPADIEQAAADCRVVTDDDTVVWQSGWIETTAPYLRPDDPLDLDATTTYRWQVRVRDDETTTDWSDHGTLRTHGPADWTADWIAAPDDSPSTPAPRLRTTFAVDGPVADATLHVTAAGNYDVRVNGETPSDRVLAPPITQYQERVLSDTVDVTDQVSAGENAISCVLGRARYALTVEDTWDWHDPVWENDRPLFRAQLEVTLADGTTERVATDDDWRTAPSATTHDSLYCGEHFDAREHDTAWHHADYDDGDWEPVETVARPDLDVTPQECPAMRPVETIAPADSRDLSDDVRRFDVGRQVAGWARISVRGDAGDEVEVRYGEKLFDDGSINAELPLVDCDLQRDHYVLDGDGVETWTPRFSYKGFRWVEVHGLADVELLDIEFENIHTPLEDGLNGSFDAEEQLLSDIRRNTRRSILNNHHGQPTDTPLWEKNGWTGDAQLTAQTAMYEFGDEMALFYHKWLRDIADAQAENGEIPSIVPHNGSWGYHAVNDPPLQSPLPGWDIAYPLIVWQAYWHFDDERFLTDHYENVCDLAAFTVSHMDDWLLDHGLGDWLSPGDGDLQRLPPEGPAIAATTYTYHIVDLARRMAATLGHEDDAAEHASQLTAIQEAFHEAYWQGDHYATGEADEYRQTSNILPLAFDMVPDEHEDAVVDSLVDDIRYTHDDHLDTGILGTRHILPVLTEYGELELAYTLATQRTYPSWGYWIENGATSLYEAWELQSRSRNHHMFGSIGQWFVEALAGIEATAPGFETVRIAPEIPGDLDGARATVETVRGRVRSDWERTGNRVELQVGVPPTATATVTAPTGWTIDTVRDADGTAVAADPQSLGAGQWTLDLRHE